MAMYVRYLNRRSQNAITDPTRTNRVVERYANTVAKLVSVAVKEAKRLFEEMAIKKEDGETPREMAAGTGDTPAFLGDIEDYAVRVRKIIKTKYTKSLPELVRKETEKQVKRAGKWSTDRLKSVGIDMLIGDMPVDEGITQSLADRHLAELLKVEDEIADRIQSAILEGIEKGEGMERIALRIEDAGKMAEGRAKTIARTEVMSAFQATTKERFKQHRVKEVIWLTGGSNVCTDVTGFDGVHYAGGCLALNKKRFNIDTMPPQPLHPNCRCTINPVIEPAGGGK